MGKQTIVIVRVFREFEYPKAMLDKGAPLYDATEKAKDDMQRHLNEIVHDDHAQLDHRLFKYEAREELGYKYRRKELDEPTKDSVNVMLAAKALATRDIEIKHGALNHELNPGLYVSEPPIQDEHGNVLRQQIWYMRQDVEQEFYNLFSEYKQLLRAAR